MDNQPQLQTCDTKAKRSNEQHFKFRSHEDTHKIEVKNYNINFDCKCARVEKFKIMRRFEFKTFERPLTLQFTP